jgi:branched-chain amino acid transport system substrate-binding protein
VLGTPPSPPLNLPSAGTPPSSGLVRRLHSSSFLCRVMVMALRLVLLFATLPLVSGCLGRSAPLPLWFGHVATLSGPNKETGESATRGIRLAVEDINKDLDQGVGRPFKVIHSDARGKLEAFEAEAVRLVTINRVSFLLGGTTAEEVERLDRARVPVLTPAGHQTRALSESVYFTGLTPEVHGKTLARFAAQELDAATVLVLQDERPEGALESADAFIRELPVALAKKDAKAVSVVRKLRFGKDAKLSDLNKLLAEQIQKESIKAVLFAGKAEDLRELGELPVPLLFAGDDGSARTLLAQRPGSKDVYMVTAFVTDADTPRAADFAKRYKKEFSEEADVHAALAYEGMKLLYEAICQSKDSLTVQRIKEELAKVKDYAGLTGALSFAEDRQLRRPAFVVRLTGGAVKTAKRYPAG